MSSLQVWSLRLSLHPVISSSTKAAVLAADQMTLNLRDLGFQVMVMVKSQIEWRVQWQGPRPLLAFAQARLGCDVVLSETSLLTISEQLSSLFKVIDHVLSLSQRVVGLHHRGNSSK
jgi:hypothetical protein